MSDLSYVILLVDVPGHDRYVHSLHLDEASANEAIEEANAAPFVMGGLTWTIEVRATREIQELWRKMQIRKRVSQPVAPARPRR